MSCRIKDNGSMVFGAETMDFVLISGVLGFMGHGDSRGFIFTHESTHGFMGFMGIHG